MDDIEVAIDSVERPRTSGGDCSLSAPALTKQAADGLKSKPWSGGGNDSEEGSPSATISMPFLQYGF